MSVKSPDLSFSGLNIFLVDDDDAIAWAIETELKILGAEIKRVSTYKHAVELLPAFGADIIISDINLPDGNGLDLLKKWRSEDITIPIILITANTAIDSAVTALRHGAFDYLNKPFAMNDLIAATKRAAEVGSLRRRITQYEGRETSESSPIIGDSKPIQRLRKRVDRIAKSKADTVLIYGESGSGKELAARAVHDLSSVAKEPFVEINCASIPETLLESELFGYEKGAFTDARDRKAGLLEIARKGTVFLDEIGEMPLKMQAKLLRVLEYRRFKRLGGVKDIEFNGRIVAATNRRLEEEIVEGRFREDLYYRLSAIPVFVPPLRDRRDDIPNLVEYLLERVCKALDVKRPKISPAAMIALEKHPWRGNVRELKNVLQRCLVFNEPAVINEEDLELQDFATPSEIAKKAQPTPKQPTEAPIAPSASTASADARFVLPSEGISLEDVEKSLLVQALERSRYNQSKACRLLGITRHTLRYRLEKFGLLDDQSSSADE